MQCKTEKKLNGYAWKIVCWGQFYLQVELIPTIPQYENEITFVIIYKCYYYPVMCG